MEFEVQRLTRHCAETGRELHEGETYYSALVTEGGEVLRRDYSAEAWTGPPEGALGWWKSRVPTRHQRRARMAPSEVLIDIFQELSDKPEQADMRYVLALLLVRRRIARLEESTIDPAGREVLTLYCPRNETTWQLPVVALAPERIGAIQDELARLLFAEAQ